MNSESTTISWLCILSVILFGCRTYSVAVDPTGAEKERVYSDEITSIVTNDGATFKFATPPAIINDFIVGTVDATIEVAILLPEVRSIQMRQLDNGETEINSVFLKDGRTYEFSVPPVTVRDSIIGVVEGQTVVSISLSDVSNVNVAEPPGAAIAAWYLFGVVFVSVAVWQMR